MIECPDRFQHQVVAFKKCYQHPSDFRAIQNSKRKSSAFDSDRNMSLKMPQLIAWFMIKELVLALVLREASYQIVL